MQKNTRVKVHTWIHNLYVYANISMVERTFRISTIFFIKYNKIHILHIHIYTIYQIEYFFSIQERDT